MDTEPAAGTAVIQPWSGASRLLSPVNGSLPGPIEPRADQRPVSHADVAPTVLEHFGVAIPEYLWGDSRANGSSAAPLVGDFNDSGALDVADIDILTSDVAANRFSSALDLNADRELDIDDVNLWIELADTWTGDVDIDGEFNSSDLTILFKHGKYETDEPALWSEGDWNADGRFRSSDFVAAFEDGGYEQGPRLPGKLVPETGITHPFAMGVFCLLVMHQRKLLQITTRE